MESMLSFCREIFQTFHKVTAFVAMLLIGLGGCIKPRSEDNTALTKGRTKTQYHVIVSAENMVFEVSDSWIKANYKWIEQRPDKTVPYTDPGFAIDLGWILAQSIRFSLNQLDKVGASSASDISTYRTKCKPSKGSSADRTRLVCNTNFDAYWDFDTPLMSSLDVWIPNVRSAETDAAIYDQFKQPCSNDYAYNQFSQEEFYSHFKIHKTECKAKDSPLFSKITLKFAIGEKTDRQGAPDYQGIWADKQLVSTFVFGEDYEVPMTQANQKLIVAHLKLFLSGSLLKRFIETEAFDKAARQERTFVRSIEELVHVSSLGKIASFDVAEGTESITVSVKMTDGSRTFDAIFILGNENVLIGNADKDYSGSVVAPLVATRSAKSDIVFYGGHTTGGIVEKLFFKKLETTVQKHALIMVFGCETTAFANKLLDFSKRPLAERPVIFASLGFQNFDYFPAQISGLVQSLYGAKAKWSDVLDGLSMTSVMHESKIP